jgi:hypothetical protein
MITGSARGTVHHTVPGAQPSITDVPAERVAGRAGAARRVIAVGAT